MARRMVNEMKKRYLPPKADVVSVQFNILRYSMIPVDGGGGADVKRLDFEDADEYESGDGAWDF